MKRIHLYKIISAGLLYLVFIFASSCTEIIELELDSSDIRLVVDGVITTDTTSHFVRITTSSSYFLNEEPPAVSGALVQIQSGEQSVTLTETNPESGIYATPSDFYGVKGIQYTLSINLAKPVGENTDYEAVTSMPTTEFSIDSIVLEYQEVWDFYLINLFAKDPPTTDFYKIDALRNGEIITDTAYRSSVTDDRFFNGNNTNGLSVMFLRADEVNPGDTITLVLSSITKEYYEFFLELQAESGSSNPLFSGPPANISSNIQQGGLGFFTAQSSVRESLVVKDLK
jgi:hypothetical protein